MEPTATPIVPTSPGREIRLIGVGIDANNDTAIERFVEFGVDGPSLIAARLSNSSSRVRMCIWRGSQIQGRVCDTSRNGTITQTINEPDATNWTITLLGATATASPTATLTIDFNAVSPSVTVDRLRYQGTPPPDFNGITAEVDTIADGTVSIAGRFDDGLGGDYSAHITIDEQGGGNLYNQTVGPAGTFSATAAVTAAHTYRISATNPNTSAEARAVFLAATITWP